MYKAYVKEKENLDVFECEFGFAAYNINHLAKEMEIGDFYIKPEFRNGVYASKLYKSLIELAKQNDCKKLFCCVVLNAPKCEDSMFLILRHRFKFSHVTNQLIYFYLDL